MIMNNVDKQYLNLLTDIKNNGALKSTRSGDVLSVFSRTMRFNLKEGFPLLTTKKVFYRGVIEELLWFISGSTNIKALTDKNVHIWDDDAYRHYKSLIKKHNSLTNALDNDIKVALNKDEFIKKVSEEGFEDLLYSPDGYRMRYIYGDLGPVYGKQWRRFGNSGVDQIKKIIDTLKTNPNDRRLLCVAFNPSDLDEMALPPCHVMFQFYVRELNDGKYGLSCKWTQRSVDSFLGLPFNIASYAALTYMIAEVVGMVPDELIADLGDTHIYCNQMKAVDEQLTRKGFDTLPTLKFGRKIDDIDDFKYEDFIIENYKSDSTIKAPLSVG
jgi:thymidylate synthase